MMRTTFLVVACVVLASISPSFVSSSVAQNYDEAAAKQRQSRKTPPLSNRVYKHLSAAMKLSDRGDYNGAMDLFAPLGKMELNAYEAAQFWRFNGFLFFSMTNYPAALVAYEKVLEQPNLPASMEDQTLLTLAQLAFITEDYNKTIDYVFRFLAVNQKAPANILALVGHAYVALEEFDKALQYMEKAKDGYIGEKKVMQPWAYKQLMYLYYRADQKYKVLMAQNDFMEATPSREGWTSLAKICTKLIEEHTDAAPLSIAELEKTREDAMNKAATPTIHRQYEYSGTNKPVEYVSPVYPREALVAGKGGEVKLLYDVSKAGNVVNIKVLFSSDPIFEPAARAALESYKFNPKRLTNGGASASGTGGLLGSAQIIMPTEEKPKSLLENPLKFIHSDSEAVSDRKNFEKTFTFSVDIWEKEKPVQEK
ncbi:energy transducer TonB [Paremcibacter congregatus]|uniref:Protein TonB n=1 Tax=Paremcibacter congregatus TaxID=2043170 RepID=A0A2G4YQB2_9PROT|nr:energy transducer TonB [Paremcibacter congregatus]PHZ84508.1 hypothetical protein CRD36_11930 [Paremcibacter congregatus]QDE28727.1 TonB family protein [Paremcibacter congregatus]